LTGDSDWGDAMRHTRIDRHKPKGWFYGPWNDTLAIPVGYANEGIRERHLHRQMAEVYLVAQGTSVAEVDGRRIRLQAGDALLVEPGEVHAFFESSADYLHFVLQVPFVADDKVIVPESDSE
jgi:mannose-6-phosphate isomerase-like protein (cupin superfamily)